MNRKRILSSGLQACSGYLWLSAIQLLACGNGNQGAQDHQEFGSAIGIYEDGWVGPDASLSLRNPSHHPGVQVVGENVVTSRADESLTLRVTFPGGRVDSVLIEAPGDFEEFLRIPQGDRALDSLRLGLTSSKAFVPSQLGTSPDDRVLAFRLTRLATVDEETLGHQRPSGYDFPSPKSAHIVGVFDDGWISNCATITLYPIRAQTSIEIRGYIPAGLPDHWEVKVNGRIVRDGKPPRTPSGVFTAKVVLPEGLQEMSRLELEIVPGGTYVPAERGLNEDRRRLSYLLDHVRMTE